MVGVVRKALNVVVVEEESGLDDRLCRQEVTILGRGCALFILFAKSLFYVTDDQQLTDA